MSKNNIIYIILAILVIAIFVISCNKNENFRYVPIQNLHDIVPKRMDLKLMDLEQMNLQQMNLEQMYPE